MSFAYYCFNCIMQSPGIAPAIKCRLYAIMEEHKQEFPIRNAGLILFHPFLETLFTRTGLMEEQQFVDDTARNRAVLLLQYLATEQTEFEDRELVLNKILCQVPLTSPVPLKLTPTPEETTVCTSLFEVIPERWSQMKHTTRTGLSESLILRNGVIKLSGAEWNLRVEQKGYDVLLQTLPWAFGLVKTKWMDKALTTEWI